MPFSDNCYINSSEIESFLRFSVKLGPETRKFPSCEYGDMVAARMAACVFYQEAVQLVTKFDLTKGQDSWAIGKRSKGVKDSKMLEVYSM